MLEICKQLFSLWNDNSVKYCHWKSNEHLMEGLEGKTDLDVYVAPSDKDLAESLLVTCRFIKCLTQKGSRYPNVCEWMGLDVATGHLVHVHLHYQIITGTKFCKEYVFPIDDLIVSTRTLDQDTNVYVTNPNLEIIILFCRIALKAKKKKRICPSLNDRREIDYLKSLVQSETVLELCNQLLGSHAEEFHSLIFKPSISSKEWYRVYQIATKWLYPYRKYSKLHVFLRHHYYNLRSLCIHVANKKYNRYFINKKTMPGRSVAICFLGQDGSGKSTVTIELCKWLNWKIAAHRFYLGSGDHYNGLLKRVITKGAKIKHRSTQQKTSSNPNTSLSTSPKKRKKNLKNFFLFILLSMNRLIVARRAYKEVLRSEKYRKKGGIPLFDRFPQNQFEGIYDGPKIAESYRETGLDYSIVKMMAKKEQQYITKIQEYQPQLVFKLMLSPEESIRRKPFENLAAVTRKHEITKQLKFPNSTIHIVDATQDYEQELVFIKKEIWNTLFQNQ